MSKLELMLGVLNGAVGDHLARTKNGLATEMTFVHRGLPMRAEQLTTVRPDVKPVVAIFLHGIMNTESIWAFADGSDYGTMLERDLGMTALHVRFNSGLAIADNGASLAALLDRLVASHPALEEIVLVGYSMGGLVARSACHYGKLEHRAFFPFVKRAVYVGTPHHGAPLERAGKAFLSLLRATRDPYARMVADVADAGRSEGLRDLGHADLRHEDRSPRSFSLESVNHPVPLLPEIEHFLVAGRLANPQVAKILGDSVVPLQSATAYTDVTSLAIPASHVRVVERTTHVQLASSPEVYSHIREFLE